MPKSGLVFFSAQLMSNKEEKLTRLKLAEYWEINNKKRAKVLKFKKKLSWKLISEHYS